ncbi:hypothetical protein HRR80_000114 [Exophiala dermatitidis]|uniref:Beta-lactamase n=3 Tax=Exophiala dermatitidis TaxID=5970 RepID=H6C8C8_EXODN|nr:beta-lactamase [Exophiala dermatitidis NIH/UT8656]KAJ4524513.1 hypothetical protein HRR75_000101 [Exophiala dermatitidis]EHY60355.1 beta-lactamase [Exophiala dermatitidis NIH/UT8656]KAJ4530919.1 hypothetical protein HRR76_008609 [Exophiala dermatitidis]KAJ4549823.1 hypothetical protein HRR78_004632 [Exophiala dermatitidis]KAJ4558091.1 hypothetical protein HRR77_000114 [Exophiala dermatitidis]
MATAFEEAITKAVAEEVVPGAAVIAVDKNGATKYAKAFGNTNVGPTGKPWQLDTTMWLASCTKISTAVAVMQCVEKGLLSLDNPISNILPEWKEAEILTGFDENDKPILKKATKSLTLRHLLTHSSGLGYVRMNPLLEKYAKALGKPLDHPQTTIRDDFKLPLLFEPGEGWEYGCSIDWAGKMVEEVNGGIRLGEYMEKNIFEPLGMTLTSFRPSEHPAVKDRLAGRPFRTPEGKVIPEAPNVGMYPVQEPQDDYGGAGLHSCAQDYIKLIASLLANDGKLLKSESVDELFRPQLKDTKYIQAVMDNPEAAAFLAPSFGTGVKWNYALGGAVAVDGVEGRIDAGTMHWAGLPNSFWWIDRHRGIGGVYANHFFPPADPPTQKLFALFQRDMYTLAG